ncbi:MAG: TM2 domain-containing protein [Saprospiraceae bacterium]|nr:TM2 domain-containing protein [Saprospiraceae bacterium]
MKKKWIAVFLAVFLGGFGVHRFYLRQPEMGILYLIIHFWLRFFLSFGIPVSRILGWVDAYRYLMMDDNEFDRKYNSQNFRDRYGNRRQAPQRPSSRYIVIEDEDTTTKKRSSSWYELRKGKKESESFKSSGIRKFKNFDITGAIEDFTKALELYPEDPITHFHIACALSIEERGLDSFKHLDQAVALGFKDFGKIMTHEALAFIRILPPFEKFKANQFRLNSEIYREVEQEQNKILESIRQQKEKSVLAPVGGTYGQMFQEKLKDEFK